MATLKIQSAEIEPFWATPEILLFLSMRFSNNFLTYMVWKYQNEIAPIFYYGISTKTNEKGLKIPILQPPDWKHPYWMSLYIIYAVSQWRVCSLFSRCQLLRQWSCTPKYHKMQTYFINTRKRKMHLMLKDNNIHLVPVWANNAVYDQWP